MEEGEYADPHRRRLKLFLSADIVGSTAYKQPFDILKDRPSAAAHWAGAIALFYETMSTIFLGYWDTAQINVSFPLSNDASLENPHRPRLWKTVGDEVIFWQELSHENDIWTSLACWMKTVSQVRESFRKRAFKNLDVKCSAWVAEFPVRNKAIPMYLESPGSTNVTDGDTATIQRPAERNADLLRKFYSAGADSTPVDFIGPGIDVGFRLSEFASAKKMAISLDVAYLMAVGYFEIKDDPEFKRDAAHFLPRGMGGAGTQDVPVFLYMLSVFYSGRETLKGVLGGMRYPKFWINTIPHGTLEFANDQLYARSREPVDWDDLLTFCESVYEDRRGYLIPPYFDRPDSQTRAYAKAFRARYEQCRRASVKY